MGLMDRVWSWFGMQSDDQNDQEMLSLPPASNEPENKKGIAGVLSIHANKNLKVVVSEPKSFEESQVYADYLKNRKQVVLNLEHAPPEVSQRIIDFVSGTAYALEGQSQQLGKNIFLFTPSNVEITKDQRGALRRSSGSYSDYNLHGGD